MAEADAALEAESVPWNGVLPLKLPWHHGEHIPFGPLELEVGIAVGFSGAW